MLDGKCLAGICLYHHLLAGAKYYTKPTTPHTPTDSENVSRAYAMIGLSTTCLELELVTLIREWVLSVLCSHRMIDDRMLIECGCIMATRSYLE